MKSVEQILNDNYNIKTSFIKNKDILTNLFINFYGEENTKVITDVIKNINIEYPTTLYSNYNFFKYKDNCLKNALKNSNSSKIKDMINDNANDLLEAYNKIEETLTTYKLNLNKANIDYVYRVHKNNLTNKEINILRTAINNNDYDFVNIKEFKNYGINFNDNLLTRSDNASAYADSIRKIYLQRATIQSAYTNYDFGNKIDNDGIKVYETDILYKKALEFLSDDNYTNNYVLNNNETSTIYFNNFSDYNLTHELIRLINSILLKSDNNQLLNIFNNSTTNIIYNNLVNSKIEIINEVNNVDNIHITNPEELQLIDFFVQDLFTFVQLNKSNMFVDDCLYISVEKLSANELLQLNILLNNLNTELSSKYLQIKDLVEKRILRDAINIELAKPNRNLPIQNYTNKKWK